MNDTPTLPRATELWAEIQKLAAERPDFRYNPDPDTPTMCYYSRGPSEEPTRATGCILGQGLQRLGVPQAYLARVDDQEIKLPADDDGEEPDDDTGIGNIWPLLIRLEDDVHRQPADPGQHRNLAPGQQEDRDLPAGRDAGQVDRPPLRPRDQPSERPDDQRLPGLRHPGQGSEGSSSALPGEGMSWRARCAT